MPQSIWPVPFPRHLLDIKLVKRYMIEAKQKGRIRELLYMTQYWLDFSQVLQQQTRFLLMLSPTPFEKLGASRAQMENPAQVPEQISSLEEHSNKQIAVLPQEPSKIHLARVLLKLLPVA